MTAERADVGRERRRHPRRPVDVAGAVVVEHAAVRHELPAKDVRDASLSGLFLDMPPLPLSATVTVTIRDVTVSGRVVRVRLDGRRRGAPISPGIAIAFAEPHPAAWDELLTALPERPRAPEDG